MLKLVAFVVINVLLYLAFSFIALEPNPMNWMLLQTVAGRILMIVFELVIIGFCIEHVDLN